MFRQNFNQYGYHRDHKHPNHHFNEDHHRPGAYPEQHMVEQNYGMRQQLLMEDAIVIARQHVPGLVVEAELKQKQGRQIFEIEIVTSQGVKYEVEIDAMNGTVIDISLD